MDSIIKTKANCFDIHNDQTIKPIMSNLCCGEYKIIPTFKNFLVLIEIKNGALGRVYNLVTKKFVTVDLNRKPVSIINEIDYSSITKYTTIEATIINTSKINTLYITDLPFYDGERLSNMLWNQRNHLFLEHFDLFLKTNAHIACAWDMKPTNYYNVKILGSTHYIIRNIKTSTVDALVYPSIYSHTYLVVGEGKLIKGKNIVYLVAGRRSMLDKYVIFGVFKSGGDGFSISETINSSKKIMDNEEKSWYVWDDFRNYKDFESVFLYNEAFKVLVNSNSNVKVLKNYNKKLCVLNIDTFAPSNNTIDVVPEPISLSTDNYLLMHVSDSIKSLDVRERLKKDMGCEIDPSKKKKIYSMYSAMMEICDHLNENTIPTDMSIVSNANELRIMTKNANMRRRERLMNEFE